MVLLLTALPIRLANPFSQRSFVYLALKRLVPFGLFPSLTSTEVVSKTALHAVHPNCSPLEIDNSTFLVFYG